MAARAMQKERGKDCELEQWILDKFDEYQLNDDISVKGPLFNALSDFSKDNNCAYDHLAYCEKYIELKPNDNDKRFDLALAYSKAGKREVALGHYLTVPHNESGSVNLNNVGVCYANLDMPGKAVESYKTAIEMGNTLSSSNLAYKYINEGFYEEASDLYKDAVKKEDFHKNIGGVITKISKLKEEESNKETKVNEEFLKQKELFLKYANARVSKFDRDIKGMWSDVLGSNFSLSLEKNNLVIEGEYEQKSLGELFGTNSEKNSDIYEIKYSGKICGRDINYKKVKKLKESNPLTLLDTSDVEEIGIMIISEDGNKIDIYKEAKLNYSSVDKLIKVNEH